jgi:hypothetical protein
VVELLAECIVAARKSRAIKVLLAVDLSEVDPRTSDAIAEAVAALALFPPHRDYGRDWAIGPAILRSDEVLEAPARAEPGAAQWSLELYCAGFGGTSTVRRDQSSVVSDAAI